MGNIFQKSYIDVHEATQSGHIDEVRRWVDEGKPVDARDNTQKTPLHHAAQWGQEEALDFLIECGADVNAADFIGDTPLHLACYFGHANCARILIMVGANVGAKDCYGNTPSQIFDDHVTEPVLDEIRFIVREVIKGPAPGLQEHEAHSSAPAPECSQECPGSGGRQDSASSVVSPCPPSSIRDHAHNNRSLGASGNRLSESGSPGTGTVFAGKTERTSGKLVRPTIETEATANQATPATAETANERPSTSKPGESPDGCSMKGGSGEKAAPASSGKISDGTGREGTAGGSNVGHRPNGNSSLSGHDASGAREMAPQIQIPLPWEDEAKPGPPGGKGAGRGLAQSPTASPARGGDSAAAGLTYPGPRPLSAPLMRPTINPSALNATSPILSGRRYEGSTPTGREFGRSVSLSRTAGASLAGTLMSYATRPGGTFDVFAAARDGQVSVLKQALTEGEDVDVQDEAGLTALMWAARAGRLSTAKYLVSQGASLERRDDSTGFTPLHFAAYYCRSSVVRALVLAGADRKAADNHGRVPGARFQALSYLSYDAFQHRRLIARFLAGDLKDVMDDKGKTMFPKNSPLEAYDEEHRPKCVRLGSRDNLDPGSDQGSGEEGEARLSIVSGSIANRARRGSGGQQYRGTSHRRASAELARKAYATMHTMHSRVDDDSSRRQCSSMSGVAGSAEGGGGGGGDGGGVRYYLRRGSLQQVAAKTKKILAGAAASGDNNSGSESKGGEVNRKRRAVSSAQPKRSRKSRGTGGGDGGVSFYFRRASLQSSPRIEGILSGRTQVEGYDDPANDMARDMAIAVAAAEAAVAGTPASPAAPAVDATADGREASVDRQDHARASVGLDEQRDLDSVEAGRRHPTTRDVNGGRNSGEDSATRSVGRGEVQGEGAGRKGEGRKAVSARGLDGTQDGAKDPQGPVDDNGDVESGMRVAGPPPMTPCMGPRAGSEQWRRPQPGAESAGAGATPLNHLVGARHSTARAYTEASRVRGEAAGIDAGSDDDVGASLSASQRPAGEGIGLRRNSSDMVDAGGEPFSSLRSHGRSAAAAATTGSVNEGGTSKASSADGEDCIAEGSVAPDEHRTQPWSNVEGVVSRRGDGPYSMQQQQQQTLSSNSIGVEESAGKSSTTAASPLGQLTGDATVAPLPDAGSGDVRNTARGRPNDASSDADALMGSKTAVKRREPAEAAIAKTETPPTGGLSAAPAPLVAVEAGTAKRTLESAISTHEGVAFAPQDREAAGAAAEEASSVGSLPSSAEEGREGASRGSAAADNAGAATRGDEETSARRGSERREERRDGRKSRKHKHKHKRSHRRRDGGNDEGGGGGKTRRRRSKDHGLFGAVGSTSVTGALAPLKRIPPPSLSHAQRGTLVSSEGDETGDGSFGGGG